MVNQTRQETRPAHEEEVRTSRRGPTDGESAGAVMLTGAPHSTSIPADHAGNRIIRDDSTSVHASAWQVYREMRVGILALAKLEEHLGSDLYDARSASEAGTASTLEGVFLSQSFQALHEQAAATIQALDTFQASIPTSILTDNQAFLAALRKNLPDLPLKTEEAVSQVMNEHGCVRDWLYFLRQILVNKQDTYQRCWETIWHQLGNFGLKVLDALGVLLRQQQSPMPHSFADAQDVLPADLRARLAEVTQLREEGLRRGEPFFLANGPYKNFCFKVSLFRPEEEAALGFKDPDSRVVPILACLFGAPGIAICVIAALIAMSSHGVKEDKDGGGTTGGDDDDGGTTG